MFRNHQGYQNSSAMISFSARGRQEPEIDASPLGKKPRSDPSSRTADFVTTPKLSLAPNLETLGDIDICIKRASTILLDREIKSRTASAEQLEIPKVDAPTERSRTLPLCNEPRSYYAHCLLSSSFDAAVAGNEAGELQAFSAYISHGCKSMRKGL